MSKIVEALEIGADAVRAELAHAKEAYKGYEHRYAHLEAEVALVESALAEARAAPTVSAEPVVWTEDAEKWGDALNDAAWVFVEQCPEKSALLFNNTKGPLRAAILKYAELVQKAAPPPVSVGAECSRCKGSGASLDFLGRVEACPRCSPPPVEASQQQASGVDDTQLVGFHVQDGALKVGLAGGACEAFARAFAEQFRDSGATNYLEARFTSELGPLVVTLQRVEGKTPHQLRAEAEAELSRLTAELSDVSGRSAEIATKAADEIDRLTAKHDAMLTVRETLRRECEALKAELSAAKAVAENVKLQAESYEIACEVMEDWQHRRLAEQRDPGTRGSLIDGIERLHQMIEQGEAEAEAMREAMFGLMRGASYSGGGSWGRIYCPTEAAMNAAIHVLGMDPAAPFDIPLNSGDAAIAAQQGNGGEG